MKLKAQFHLQPPPGAPLDSHITLHHRCEMRRESARSAWDASRVFYRCIVNLFAFYVVKTRRLKRLWPGLSPMGRKNLSRARESIISNLSLVTKSGVYRLGINQTLKALRSGEAKLVIFASNIAPAHKSLIEYYAMLSQCDILPFDGDNIDLGTACGKYFRSSVIAIINAGESEILKMIKEKPE